MITRYQLHKSAGIALAAFYIGMTACIATLAAAPPPSTAVDVQLEHPAAADQDDLCFWYDAKMPEQSRVITSDKSAGLVAVYDLKGDLQQLVKVPKPGNIDIRQNVDCAGIKRDLVVVNQRTDGWKLVVLEMNREERQLHRLDQGNLATGPNYGGCLYLSPGSGELYAVTTSEDSDVEQHRIVVDAQRVPSLKKMRDWKLGKCEGAVADDELGRLYISVEEEGVWELGAEPGDPVPGKLVIKLGEHGLKPDLEGIALCREPMQSGYLILSSQGQNQFFVYDRQGNHAYRGKFSIDGVEETDGLEVMHAPLGDRFPKGIFGCHNGANKPCPVVLIAWDSIAEQLKKDAASEAGR